MRILKKLRTEEDLEIQKDGSVTAAIFSSGPFEDAELSGHDTPHKKLLDRIKRLESFRSGVLQILKDLDTQEAELDGAYERLGIAQERLIQSSKLGTLGELAAGLAHELNQPVTIIKGLAQSLLKDIEASPDSIEKVRLIAEASSRMESIIRHMNVFTRSTDEPNAICDINSIIRYAFRLSAETMRQNAITAELDLGDMPPVKGSHVRLEQVMINLIANAIGAMPGGGTVKAATSSRSDDNGLRYALISISDTGTGIASDDLEMVFEPFFTTKEPGKGTGLGLSISRGIIRDHGGDITVESSLGAGTTFRITLPAAYEKKE